MEDCPNDTLNGKLRGACGSGELQGYEVRSSSGAFAAINSVWSSVKISLKAVFLICSQMEHGVPDA